MAKLSKDRCHSNKSTIFPPASHRVRWTKDFISLCKIMFCKTQFHGICFDFFQTIILKILFLFYWTFSLPTSRFLCHIFSHLFHDLFIGICLFTMVTRQNIFNQLLFWILLTVMCEAFYNKRCIRANFTYGLRCLIFFVIMTIVL